MKLIEKLATEASKPITNSHSASWFEDGFEAGFRKALELAQTKYNNAALFPRETNALTFLTSIANYEVSE